jgi:hypothetical protein
VSSRKTRRSVVSARLPPQRSDFLDLKKAKESVVTVATVFARKKAEEKEHVARANALLCEVRLGGASLAKYAPPVVKHRVLMTEAFRLQSPLRCSCNNIA